MIFGRVKPLDAILATAERKSLHRTLGAFQLTLFGIGCVIGTGIFVLTSAGAQKAGPGLMLAFAIAGAISLSAPDHIHRFKDYPVPAIFLFLIAFLTWLRA